MQPSEIVQVLLEVEDDFDPREYFNQASLESIAERLGLTWLNWGVWYKEVGPWRLYVDPWQKQPWMEVEVGLDTGNDQIPIVARYVSQQNADEILPAVVDILTQYANHQGRTGDDAGVGDKIEALLKPHVVYEAEEDFDAREYFDSMRLKGQAVADDLGFEPAHHSLRKIVGQWIVYLTPGSNYNLINVYRDFGWQSEVRGLYYTSDENVDRVAREILGVLQAHTDEHGWITGEREAQAKLDAIPHQQ